MILPGAGGDFKGVKRKIVERMVNIPLKPEKWFFENSKLMLDTPKNIFDRLVFSDENDEIYEDTEYKNAHKDYYLSDIREDIFFYEQSYSHIKNKFFVNNDRIEKVADRLIKEFKLENL